MAGLTKPQAKLEDIPIKIKEELIFSSPLTLITKRDLFAYTPPHWQELSRIFLSVIVHLVVPGGA